VFALVEEVEIAGELTAFVVSSEHDDRFWVVDIIYRYIILLL
jgi:hypothetical protein